MIQFDPVQLQVLGLDPASHATVLGAPGSGKTTLLVEAYARLFAAGWREADLLVLGTNRLVATRLRRAIEARVDAPLAGTPARTAASFAFDVLTRQAARAAVTPPRLLTGTAHDEAIAEVIDEWIESGQFAVEASTFAPEVLRSSAFRAELREFMRVLDDFGLEPATIDARLGVMGLSDRRATAAEAPSVALRDAWKVALHLSEVVEQRLARTRPGEHASSRLLRAACEAIRVDESVEMPRLVLVDDAQEVGEGELALLAALTARGSALWVFGDTDMATGTFRGERSRILARLSGELRRRGGAGDPAQAVCLTQVHRHGESLRRFTASVTDRIGAAGLGQQRTAEATARTEVPESIRFARVASGAELYGVTAHRLRRRRLGLDQTHETPWSDMAVVCRDRAEVARAARILAGHQVPTSVAAGGVVLKEHQLVRELIRLLQHAIGVAPLRPDEVGDLLGGTIGGLDPLSLRRLRSQVRLAEIRAARAAERDPARTDEILADAIAHPAETPLVDSRGGRRLRALGRLIEQGLVAHRNGGTPRETLWALWDASGLAPRLQAEALGPRGARADEAHRSLDAVLGLFFALQRHEEQNSEQPIDELLEALLSSAIPEDSLAGRGERDVVTITTPQGLIGREFSVVCLLGVQDGSWPNLRSRGLILGVTALERWLRGDAAEAPSRKDTLHDELRLFAHAISRARDELLVVALADEDHQPSPFFGLGRAYEAGNPLPSSRLTMRGSVAEMRRRVTQDPSDTQAVASLLALADAGVPGADPDEWYGVLPPSTVAPLVDLSEPERTVKVSPSGIERAESCPLDWIVSKLGGGPQTFANQIGTLLHRAMETVTQSSSEPPTLDGLMRVVDAHWEQLRFDADWQEERQRRIVREMAGSVLRYLSQFDHAGSELLGTEIGFSMRVGHAQLSGTADRLEARTDAEGRRHLLVVDLKTGATAASAKEVAEHAQLRAYQLGVLGDAFEDLNESEDWVNDGARLLYVHPKTLNTRHPEYRVGDQAPLDDETAEAFRARVDAVATIMAASTFEANVEHHCTNSVRGPNTCSIHIVPAVSHA